MGNRAVGWARPAASWQNQGRSESEVNRRARGEVGIVAVDGRLAQLLLEARDDAAIRSSTFAQKE